MEVRPATPDDRAEIQKIARESFETSYSLSPLDIDTIVENVFDEDRVEDRIEDPNVLVLVAEDDEQGVVGFADADLGDHAVLHWLHVSPDARGMGAGTTLVEEVQETFAEEDLEFRARVLEEASEGKEFLERFDLHRTGSDHPDYADESVQELIYTEHGVETDPNEPAVEVPPTITDGGDEHPVGRDDPIPGTESPFFHVFADESSGENWGYFCSNCGSPDVSADGLDRLECSSCGNEHRAEEWDKAYL